MKYSLSKKVLVCLISIGRVFLSLGALTTKVWSPLVTSWDLEMTSRA